MNSITPKKKVYSDLPTGEKMADMARFLQEHKAQNVTTIDLSGRGSFTDGLVIATATSVRHAQSLADGISALCHEKKYEYLRMDGYTNGQWLLVDCNDVVVNIFQEATREMYNLEALWSVPSSREELRTMAAKAEKAEAKKASRKAKAEETASSTPIEKTTLGDISALAALKEKMEKGEK